MDLLRIDIDDGKYTLIQYESGAGEILRNGETWMTPLCNVNGSKMILAMGYELERLRAIKAAAKGLFDALDADSSNQNQPIWDAHDRLGAALA